MNGVVFLPGDEMSCLFLDLKLELVYVGYICKVGQPVPESSYTRRVDNAQDGLW